MTPERLADIEARCDEWQKNHFIPCRHYCKLLTEDMPDCIKEIERLHGMEKALRDLYNDCRNEPCDAQRGAVMDRARKALEAE